MNFRIKEICKEQNLSIGELASKIGIVRESLSRIISSGSTSTETLERIASALGVQVVDLFEKKGDFVAFVRRNGDTHTFSSEQELKEFVDSLEEGVKLEVKQKE